MGKGGLNYATLVVEEYSWDEIKERNSVNKEIWIVIDDAIYDVTRWGEKHPGGNRILSHYAGQDASVSI